jgi:parallel beta-helix repeat protein
VSGVCTEPEINIGAQFMNLILIGVRDSQGTKATLQGTSPLGNVISIGGRNITVQGLRITSAGAKYGVTVYRGGTALIDNCVIEGFAGGAITVNQWAFARITNNTLQNNGEEGIFVSESSAVRVGFRSTDDLTPMPNTIQNNGLAGIRVTRTSNARITGNAITGNLGGGILIENNSHADVAWNELSGNLAAGIRVHLNSSARLGIGSGKPEWDVANSTTANNLGAGLECTLGGAVEGDLGTLRGEQGSHKFGLGCVHDLNHSKDDE